MARSQDGTLLTPQHLPAGKTLHVWHSAAVPTDAKPTRLLEGQIRDDEKRGDGLAGRKATCQTPADGEAGMVVQACRFDGASNPPLFAQYMLVPRPDGTRAIVRIVLPDDEALVRRQQAGIASALKLAVHAAPSGTAGTEYAANQAPSVYKPFMTSPNAGLQPSQVLGLAQHIEYQGMQYNPMNQSWSGEHRVEQFLLLRDGSIRKGWPDMPLEDFDAAASRKGEPSNWGEWKARVAPGQGGFYDVRWPNGQVEKLSLSFAVPASRDDRLDGYYYRVNTATIGTAGMGGTFSSAWSGILFRRDGSFESGQGGSSDHAGSTGSVHAQQRSSMRGRYRLSGTALELRFDSGRVERLPFVFSSEEKDWIVVGGQRLLKRK